MDDDRVERQKDTQDVRDVHDVHEEIAAIETESDMLARKNETPEEIEEARRKADKYQAEEIREKADRFALKKRRNFKPNKWALTGVGTVLVALVALWFVPASRYAFLNVIGMRSDITITSTQAMADGTDVQSQVKNFTATVDGKSYESGDASEMTIRSQIYGKHSIEISKAGYATQTIETTVDFDPLFGLLGAKEKTTVLAKLVAEGLPVSFFAKDWISGTNISQGSFTIGDITAQPEENGKVSFIVPPTSGDTVAVKAEFSKDYLGKSFEVSVSEPEQSVEFVPSERHYFVSKRSGVYSVYSSYLDGSDLKELIKGTNQETSSLRFAVSPSGDYGVMASTREGRRDNNGDLVQKLYWVNLASGELKEVDSARNIYLHDWYGDTITYSYSYQEKDETVFRQRLRSLDTMTGNRYDLSNTSGFFERVHTTLGVVLFTKQENFGKPGFEKGITVNMVDIDGKNSRELATNIGELRQLGFDTFAYQTTDKKWNEIVVNTSQIKSVEPPREQGAIYLSTQNANQERIFINFVDGKRILMLQQKDGKTRELATQPGLSGPIRFLNATTIVYRVITPTETADYAVSTLGGEPKKVTDVTASSYATPVFFQYY